MRIIALAKEITFVVDIPYIRILKLEQSILFYDSKRSRTLHNIRSCIPSISESCKDIDCSNFKISICIYTSPFLFLSSTLGNFRSRFWVRVFVIRPFVCVDSSGIDNNPTVFYHLMPGSTAQTNKFHTFYLQQRGEQSTTWADIKVNHPLDYESIKEYNLTIRVEV